MSDTTPAEHHLRVSRTARYWVLGGAAPPAETWIACHGYGQLASRFMEAFAAIASPQRRIVTPEALNRFYLDARIAPHGPDSPVGATWMTREDRLHEIDDYIAYLDAVHATTVDADAPVVALGFSQGVATAARWAAHTQRRIDAVVLWGGTLPPELEPASSLFRDARLILVSGDNDRMVPPSAVDSLGRRLDDAGLRHDRVRHAAGHAVTADALAAVATLVRAGRTL